MKYSIVRSKKYKSVSLKFDGENFRFVKGFCLIPDPIAKKLNDTLYAIEQNGLTQSKGEEALVKVVTQDQSVAQAVGVDIQKAIDEAVAEVTTELKAEFEAEKARAIDEAVAKVTAELKAEAVLASITNDKK